MIKKISSIRIYIKQMEFPIEIQMLINDYANQWPVLTGEKEVILWGHYDCIWEEDIRTGTLNIIAMSLETRFYTEVI